MSQLLPEALSRLSVLKSEGQKRAVCGEEEQSDTGELFTMELVQGPPHPPPGFEGVPGMEARP